MSFINFLVNRISTSTSFTIKPQVSLGQIISNPELVGTPSFRLARKGYSSISSLNQNRQKRGSHFDLLFFLLNQNGKISKNLFLGVKDQRYPSKPK